jgi:hypothetical protein
MRGPTKAKQSVTERARFAEPTEAMKALADERLGNESSELIC